MVFESTALPYKLYITLQMSYAKICTDFVLFTNIEEGVREGSPHLPEVRGLPGWAVAEARALGCRNPVGAPATSAPSGAPVVGGHCSVPPRALRVIDR